MHDDTLQQITQALAELNYDVTVEAGRVIVATDDVERVRRALHRSRFVGTRTHSETFGVWIDFSVDALIPVVLKHRDHKISAMPIRLRRGAVFSFIGPDGSGKSTIVEALKHWAAALEPEEFYLGHGDPVTAAWKKLAVTKNKLLRINVTAAKPVVETKDGRPDRSAQKTKPKNKLRETVRDVASVALATKKRALLNSIRESRIAGKFVVTDRYPHADLYWIDGPAVKHRDSGTIVSPLLATIEKTALKPYGEVQPNIVFKLILDPEVSWARKRENRIEEIEQKVAAIEAVEFDRAKVIEIDAEEPLEVVLENVKREIWSALKLKKIEFIGMPASGKTTVSNRVGELLEATTMSRTDRQKELGRLHAQNSRPKRLTNFVDFANRRKKSVAETVRFASSIRPRNRDTWRRALMFIKEVENTTIWERRFSEHRDVEVHEQHILQEIWSVAYLHHSPKPPTQLLAELLHFAPELVFWIKLPLDENLARMNDRLAAEGALGEVDAMQANGTLSRASMEEGVRTFETIVSAAREVGIDIVEVDGLSTPEQQSQFVIEELMRRHG